MSAEPISDREAVVKLIEENAWVYCQGEDADDRDELAHFTNPYAIADAVLTALRLERGWMDSREVDEHVDESHADLICQLDRAQAALAEMREALESIRRHVAYKWTDQGSLRLTIDLLVAAALSAAARGAGEKGTP